MITPYDTPSVTKLLHQLQAKLQLVAMLHRPDVRNITPTRRNSYYTNPT